MLLQRIVNYGLLSGKLTNERTNQQTRQINQLS
jgi:hypothetical protein